ncbi:MAG: hypothetical protein Q8M08_10030 [Bacteroidales bacterium]|nr:hypothetical protein [Bacteroidales bacterium]
MKTQNENSFITDWQICSYDGSEMDQQRETNGIEEEIENGFFNFGHDVISDKVNYQPAGDRNEMAEAIVRWESSRYVI